MRCGTHQPNLDSQSAAVKWGGEERRTLLSARLLGCMELRLQDRRTARPEEHVALPVKSAEEDSLLGGEELTRETDETVPATEMGAQEVRRDPAEVSERCTEREKPPRAYVGQQ